LNLYRDADPVDVVTISAADPKVDHYVLQHLVDSYGDSANGPYYARLVRGMWVKRRIGAICAKAASAAKEADATPEDILAALEAGVFGLSMRPKSSAAHVREIIPEVRGQIDAIMAGGNVPGIKTGFRSLDDLLRPWGPGDYIILAATPSVGKTTLACNLAINAARKQEISTLILSLEMDKNSVTRKLIQICGGVDMQALERGKLKGAEAEMALARGYRELTDLPIAIDDQGGLTPLELRSRVRSSVASKGVGLIIVDYLQLMQSPKSESRAAEVSVISREVKAAAKEARVPIVALSQLSRAGAEVQPRLNHLRESGSLEQDADVVILLSRTDQDGIVMADVAKQRTGPTGEVKLAFDKPTQRFRDVFQYREPTPPATSYKEPENADFDQYVRSGFGTKVDPVEELYQEDDMPF
jgi:replicative DNA helicase